MKDEFVMALRLAFVCWGVFYVAFMILVYRKFQQEKALEMEEGRFLTVQGEAFWRYTPRIILGSIIDVFSICAHQFHWTMWEAAKFFGGCKYTMLGEDFWCMLSRSLFDQSWMMLIYYSGIIFGLTLITSFLTEAFVGRFWYFSGLMPYFVLVAFWFCVIAFSVT